MQKKDRLLKGIYNTFSGLSVWEKTTYHQRKYFLENTNDRYRTVLRNAMKKSMGRYLGENQLGKSEFDSVMIEITRRCNKEGCHMCYHGNQKNSRMSDDNFDSIMNFSLNNSSMIFWSGGEPFLDERVLKSAEDYGDLLFLAFTNGDFLNDNHVIDYLSELGNLIPILGIEGSCPDTHDTARGKGSYEIIEAVVDKLHEKRVPWMVSSVVTTNNFEDVTSESFGNWLQKNGAIAFKMHHYFPVGDKPDTSLILSPEQEIEFGKRRKIMNDSHLFNVMYFSGNKAKCKGFIYFDVNGNVKMCPYFHYSPFNIKEIENDADEKISVAMEEWKNLSKNGNHYCPLVSNPSDAGNFVDENGWKAIGNEQAIIRDPSLFSRIENDYRKYLELKN